MRAATEPVVWAHEDAPFTGAQVRDLLAENARLRAMNDANERWIEGTWPTIEDKALGDLVRERDEAVRRRPRYGLRRKPHSTQRNHVDTGCGFRPRQ